LKRVHYVLLRGKILLFLLQYVQHLERGVLCGEEIDILSYGRKNHDRRHAIWSK
jgi:hypothetical protein